ncbi:MAG TPA: AAA family ATPase, partial [Burkholderiaceae bacterium]|nr:AAA family ATPase [Burkholderiaceae bacterium]
MKDAKYSLGLVVGKFSPLHLGHCLLIQRAISQCERVVVLSYSVPEFPLCSTERRQRWLDSCFRSCINIVVPHSLLQTLDVPPNTASDEAQQLALLRLLKHYGYSPDAFFASESWLQECVKRMSVALGKTVTGVCIDLARRAVPVSASLVRNDLENQLSLLPTVVRADLAPRIALLGGESTGKSTLAKALTQRLKGIMVREFGREYWIKKKGTLTSSDLAFIALRQSRLERLTAARSTGYVICDTTPLTTLFYHRWTLPKSQDIPARMLKLADQHYDLTVLCKDDIPYEQDGTRESVAFRLRQQSDYKAHMLKLNTPWIEVHGNVQQRVEAVVMALNNSKVKGSRNPGRLVLTFVLE